MQKSQEASQLQAKLDQQISSLNARMEEILQIDEVGGHQNLT